MNITVIGAGAVGGYYAARLALAGHAVSVLLRDAAAAAVIARDGLLLEEGGKRQRVALRASTSPTLLDGAELVLVCVKSGDTEALATRLHGHLRDATTVLSFQNGVDNAEWLSAALGRPVIAAILYVAAQRVAVDHVRHHGGGGLRLGHAPASARIAQVFGDAGIEAQVSSDIVADLWDKLLINCAFNATSAITQRTYGEMVRDPEMVGLMRQVILEGLAVARGAGVRPTLDPDEAIRRIATTMAAQRSSTAMDLAAGRRTEVDYLNGHVVRRGR